MNAIKSDFAQGFVHTFLLRKYFQHAICSREISFAVVQRFGDSTIHNNNDMKENTRI